VQAEHEVGCVSNFRPRLDTVLQVGQDKARVGDELSHEGPTRAVSKTWVTRSRYGTVSGKVCTRLGYVSYQIPVCNALYVSSHFVYRP